jgi:imidazolonepropionase-like amidohydrolase
MSPDRRYLRAARVVPAIEGRVIEDGVVAIDGSRIAAVGPAAGLADELARGPVEHFPDGTLLPGLVDAHAHLTLAADRRTYEQMTLDPDEMMALVSLRNLRRHLGCGVTTLRDNGGRNRVTFVVREAIDRGYFVGPRLLLSGRPLTHRLGHFHWCNGVADGLEAIRAVVRQLVAEGADHIKIMASGGATAGNYPYYASYTADELRVAVETAHGLGRLTTAHCRAAQSMVNALEAGLDCIEHAEFLIPGEVVEYGGAAARSGVMRYDERITERLVRQGTFVSYTFQAGGYDSLVELRARRDAGRLSGAESARRDRLEAYFEAKLGIFHRLLGDGMRPRLAVSSDAGPFDCEFGRIWYGLELAVLGGMTPVQAIESMTAVAAEACGIGHLTGSLAAGKEADLLVVGGNPLADIRRMGDVVAVYKGGARVAPIPEPWIPPGS